MKVLYFRGIDDDIKDPVQEKSSDESTIEFETGNVVNVERDSDNNITVYLDPCGWYFSMTLEEWELIKNPTDVRPSN